MLASEIKVLIPAEIILPGTKMESISEEDKPAEAKEEELVKRISVLGRWELTFCQKRGKFSLRRYFWRSIMIAMNFCSPQNETCLQA